MNKLSIFGLLLVVSVAYGQYVPQSEHCRTVLTPGAIQCDRDFRATDAFCKNGYAAIKRKYKSCDTEQCGNEYSAFDKSCKANQAAFKAKCYPVYEDYIEECATPGEVLEDQKEVAANAKDNLKKQFYGLSESRYNFEKHGGRW